VIRSIVTSGIAGWSVLLAGMVPAAAQEKEKQQKLFSYFDPTAPAAAPERKIEAQKLAQKLWNKALSACEGSALQTVNERLMIELDRPKFTLVSMRIPPAAKEVGYEFRGIALATADRWRWATRGSGTPKWSAWETGDTVTVRDDNLTLDRGNTVLRNVVLKFDLWMKDGVWSATAPISSVSYAIKPINLTTLPATPPAAACLPQMAGA
jgi:hypothetical protein